MSLLEIYQSHEGKGGGKWLHYPAIYERYLQKFVGTDVLIWEIGVCRGGCLQVWKKFFGPKAKIIGIDTDPYTQYEEPQIVCELGDQTSSEFLNEVLAKHGVPDVIIDDGSHRMQDMLQTMAMCYPQINPGGVYIIEDTHSCYSTEYSGGIASPFNIHTILGRSSHDPSLSFIAEPYQPTFKDLAALHFHNSIVVLEKEPLPDPSWGLKEGERTKPFFYGNEAYKNENVERARVGKHEVSQIGEKMTTSDGKDLDPTRLPGKQLANDITNALEAGDFSSIQMNGQEIGNADGEDNSSNWIERSKYRQSPGSFQGYSPSPSHNPEDDTVGARVVANGIMSEPDWRDPNRTWSPDTRDPKERQNMDSFFGRADGHDYNPASGSKERVSTPPVQGKTSWGEPQPEKTSPTPKSEDKSVFKWNI